MDMVLVFTSMKDQKTIMPLCMINVDRIQQVTIVPENAEGSTNSYRSSSDQSSSDRLPLLQKFAREVPFRSDQFRSDQFRVDVRIRLDSDTEKYEDVPFYTGRLANCLEVASYYYAKDWGRLNQIAALGLLESVFGSALSLRIPAYDYEDLEVIKSEVLSVYNTFSNTYAADVDFTEVASKARKAIDSLEEEIDEWESEEPPVAAEFIKPHRHAIRLLKIALRFLQ